MERTDRVIDQLAALHPVGVFSAAQAGRLGVTYPMLHRWVQARRIVRVVHGWYAKAGARSAQHWSECVVSAVIASHDGLVVASHHSALHRNALPVFGCPDVAHVTHRTRRSMRRTSRYVVHGADAVAAETVGETVSVAASIVQCGVAFGPVPALVAGDAALVDGRATRAEIAAMVEVYRHAPGVAALRAALPLLDPSSESVGESLLRYALHLLGWQVTSQYRPVRGRRRCDFRVVNTPLVIEFDGMGKFEAAASATPAQARAAVRSAVTSVFSRDEELAAQGLHVLHVTWHELLDAGGTLCLAALDRRIRTRLAAIAA